MTTRGSTVQVTSSGWFQEPDSPRIIPVDPFVTTDTFDDNSFADSSYHYHVVGIYEEINEYDDLYGYNMTFGMLWAVGDRVIVGATLDLPWTADGRLKKTVTYTSLNL